jgi:hypothetical protein
MATNTYVALDKITVGTAVSSVTFTGISQAYTDLVIVVNGTSSTAMDSYVQVNGDTGSNYSFTRLYGTGSVAASDRGSSQTSIKAGNFSTSPNANLIHFMNYSNTTTFKTMLPRSGDAGTGSAVIASVGLWRNTSAITSITLFTLAANIAVGSTFSLYGIKAE